MSLKNNNQYNNELDLIEIFLIFSKYKWKISLFILVPIILMFLFIISQPKNDLSYVATTEIKPISTFDEIEYESYNSYLKNTDYENVFYSFNPFVEDLKKSTTQKAFVFKDIDFYNNTDNSSFKKIDKAYLLNLFVDRLKENSIFIKAIKEYNLLKRENYENNQAYENAIIKLSNSIKIKNVENEIQINEKEESNNLLSFNIVFNTNDREKWEKILFYIEKTANREIQTYLSQTFNRLILIQKKLKIYKVEDIDILLSGARSSEKEMYKIHLETLKSDILKNRNIERLQQEFRSTPIIKSENFYAAKLMVKSTFFNPSNVEKYRMTPMLIMAGIIGGFIGIFYALMMNSIRNRS